MSLLWTHFPLTDPVLIFAVILFIILLAPIFLHRFKIPDLIGLILAGALIGPHGLGIMARDSSIELFGKVGLLYIMFIAGLEIDMADLKKSVNHGVYFGLLTFLIPMLLGTLAGVYLLDFSLLSSILLASMFASHTLMTYPIVSKYGISKNRAVSVSIGATVITCLLSLLVLAVIVGMSVGEIDSFFWWRLSLSTVVFVGGVLFFFPRLGRWFFKHYEDSIAQYIFVLALVFTACFFSQLAGLEDIIGAFLAGLALNRLIPNTSSLMSRIEFVGNALFIPFFLIGVGMLVDYRVFMNGWASLWVALVMCVVATFSKWVAAFITERTFHYTRDEGRLLFGLSNAQAAATLAAVLVGYRVVLGETPDGEVIRLLDENVLNGTIIMILVTCTIASFVTQKGAQNVAIADIASEPDEGGEPEDRVLIPLSNAENVESLISLGTAMTSKKSRMAMTALSIIKSDVDDEAAAKRSQVLLDKAAKAAAAADRAIEGLIRYDNSVSNGIKHAVKEHQITDIVLGLRKSDDISTVFLGKLTERVLTKCATTTVIYRPVQPLSTVKRYVVLVPPDAEKEIGFPYWLIRLWNLSKNTGNKLVFFGNYNMLAILQDVQKKHRIVAEFNEFSDWDDFLIVSRSIRPDDALLVVMSRKNCPSYVRQMAQIPGYLNRYFQSNSCMLIFPVQLGIGEEETGTFRSLTMVHHQEGEDLANVLGRLFKRNK